MFKFIRGNALANIIAFFALCFSSIPLYDFLHRKCTPPKIDIHIPAEINFRTKQILGPSDSKGNLQFVHEETGDLQTYAILPVSYINRGDPGEDLLISSEQLRIQLGDRVFTYKSAYSTFIAPRILPSWLGETHPRLPTVLGGGHGRSDEVVFVPLNDSKFTWRKFLEALGKRNDEKIEISILVRTFSGKTYKSVPCQVSINKLLNPLKSVQQNQTRYYWTSADCE